MKVSIKDMAKKLQSANSFIITAHINPDGDALGSCLGLMYMLESLGKEVRVVIDDDLGRNFHILPGIEKIEKPLEDGNFYKADYLVLLDASMDRCGKVLEQCKDMPVLNIDHHVSNDDKADFLCLDAAAPACAEIIYRLAKEMQIPFTLEMATNLYTGMATDTGYFRYSNTKPSTMYAVAELMETGIRPEKISEALETRTKNQVKDLAAALQTVEVSADGKIAGVYLPYETVKDLESTEGFIDQVRVIEGVDVAIILKEIEPGTCRLSMRSKITDVSSIAKGLGGGGHIRAAGATVGLPLAEARTKVLKAISEAMPC